MPIDSVRAGALLVAPPMQDDPNFQRAVVLLCDHNEEGSFGLVLNRQLSLQLGDILEELEAYKPPLLLGGPVQPNTLHYVHRLGNSISDAIEVVDGVYWGGDFESVKETVQTGNAQAQSLRFFLGYAGWTAGQLGQEIEAGGWIVANGEPDFIFSTEPAGLWRAVLLRMGGEYAWLANFPDDPRLN